ncbi:Vacuolar-sorting-associated 13 protein C-terminal [Phytophthora infestans]|uniref:Vacuolar-sorting-associated 13 protein C-terminal n=1 Tax=Phytophthora infestans TaxID=4787 RepID=A0A8S9U2Q9_PHYIN|nr:Vacuolar-sorting-associated 13 protein C-terminal [Phytophthora infestans]
MWTLLLVLLLLGLVAMAAFAAFGDVVLTLLLRQFAASSVGAKFSISWSLRDGSLELCDLVVGKHVMPELEPLAGLPFGLERLEMKRLLLVVPLWAHLVRVVTGQPVDPKHGRMESKLLVGGLRVGLRLDTAEKWMWHRHQNAERCVEAVKQAAKARLARINTWTATIVQKLKDLATLRKRIREAEKPQRKKTTEQAPSKPSSWHLWVDEILDSFEFMLQSFSLLIRDEYSGATVGIAMEEFEMGRSGSTDDNRRKRAMRLVDYEMFLNSKPGGSANACHLIAPLTMEIGVFMPFIFQSLIMGQGTGERAFELEVSFAKGRDFDIELRPAQAGMLLKLLQPINYYYDWQTAASIADDLACVQLGPAESEEYMSLFNEQWKLDNEKSFLFRLYEGYKLKEAIVKRKARLDELEVKVLATQLLYLRSLSLGWEIPNAGEPLSYVSEEDLERGNLRNFVENPADHYVDKDKIPETPPMFHLFRLSFKMKRMNLVMIEDNEKKLMTFFVQEVEFELRYRMTKIAKNDTAVEIALDAVRFGLLDNRDAPTNVFRQIMDRNPEAKDMMSIAISQRGDGYMDIGVTFKHFSLLLVFDPLLDIMHKFLPAISEDEKEQMRFIDCEMADAMDSPERRDAVKHLYLEDLPKAYSPLLLGGMQLGCSVLLQGCEFCLIGDSKTLKSPVLAFTADTKVRVLSSERSEAVELELVDVALTPCTIILRDDAIELDIGDLRTILELEGEGVDFSMGYRLTVGDPAKVSSKFGNKALKGTGKSASSLWNVARKAATKPQVIEAEHPDIEEVEERSVTLDRRDRAKADARRKLMMQMSDFALNLSPTDLGILLSILASLNESMKEDIEVIKKREEGEARMMKARRKVEEKRYMERLKEEFKLRDTDGGGTLDVSEIGDLLRSATDCDNLTKTEFDATVADFVSIVDSDGSGDISLEEFENALSRNKILYTRLHHNVVSITGQEYVHPDMQRNKVPYLSGDSANTLANAAALAFFWEHYEEQIGASMSSLKGQRPVIVQKKMVRAFKNYDYAQEAWNRIVKPSLVKPGEQSSWLLTKEMDMGGRGDVIDQLLSSLKDDAHDQATLNPESVAEQQIFVQTVVSTSFGGFYLRLIDEMLPMGTPAIEMSLEELGIYANFSVWEGASSNPATDLQARERSENSFGVAKISFDVYGNYYNTKARQIEPFIEFYQGILDIRKEPASPLEVVYSSDRYFQLNVTSAFMEAVNSNVATFSKAEHRAEAERPHVKEIGAIFWMLNECGVNVKYYMVAKKRVKERVQEEIVTAVTAVPTGGTHACKLLDNSEAEEYEQQSLKEKQLRQAYRDADQDGSGELDTEEVRSVLRSVYEEEDKQRRTSGKSSLYKRSSSSILDNEAEFAQAVEDFIALADTDKSGQVSWEEFKIAIAKSRSMVDHYISVEIEGYRTIHGVPLMSIGQTQVFELTPFFDDVESEKSIEILYDRGVALLTKVDEPTREELQMAYACLRRVKDIDPNYEWIDSYYADCVRQYLPVLAAVHISVDGLYGLQVKVSGAECVRNGTAKDTELQMYNELGEAAPCNPEQNNGEERFFMLPALGMINIPLDLVGAGSFAIRQTGETEWSNKLELSVSDQRLYKKMTKFEQIEAKKALRGESNGSVSSARRVKEKLGTNAVLPDPSECVPAGKEVIYPSSSIIDNQPTVVIEKISANNSLLGTWSLTIQPQLVLHNVLPCGVEYAIVQPGDCPADKLTSKGEFRVVDNTGKDKKSRAVKTLGQIDYFAYVNEVNSRKMWVESGKTIQVFGLDLSKPALMMMRLCASESIRAATWSAPFLVHLEAERESFNEDAFELLFDDGPSFVFHPQWEENSARSVFFYSPFWIQNRSGLDLRFKLSRGRVCTVEEHRAYFPDAKEIPVMATASPDKALIGVRPFQETPPAYEGESLVPGTTKKYLPDFEKLGWSEPEDMATVSKKGELRPSGSGNYSFVLAFEIRAAPAQFFRSKIFVISPRFVLLNHVPRSLQMTPILLDKKGNRGRSRSDQAYCTLREGEAVVVYRLRGPEKYVAGLRIRDAANETQDVGEWSPTMPLFKLASKMSDPNVTYNMSEDTVFWTRGSLGDGPVCSVNVHEVAETVFATVSDISTNPNYRIENRSTRCSFRYVQHGVKTAEEIVLGPMESHSFAWEDPKGDLELRVTATHWKVPTLVDFMQIGQVKNTPQGLFGEVYIDGSTRVFAMGDTKVYSDVRQRAVVSDWLSNTVIDVSVHGVGITLVDEQPQEILNITMETIRFDSKAESRRVTLMVHHVQFDDMTQHSAYPVVFAPLDSGFNSDKREGWLPGDGEKPFFTLSCETLPQTGIVIVNDFDLQLGSMAVKLNLEYLIGLSNLVFQFIPGSDEATILQQGLEAKNSMLVLNIPFPDGSVSAGMLMYFRRWHMSGYDFDLVFDSLQEGKGEGITAILGNTMGSIVGGIAHVTPEFHFGEILYHNRFFNEYDLIYDVVLKIVHSVIGQWYKIVGSVEMLGDPVGLATDIVDGFALAARQLKRDVRGKSRRKGESAVTVVQTVFGVPLRSIGKVSNGLGDVVKKATYFESQEDQSEPRHIPEGFMQGGKVLGKSIAYGVTGFVKEPVRGAKSGGVKGFAKGIGRGTLQLVASPVVGTLGVVEKLAQSVSNTTHLMDEKHFEGTRRPARNLQTGSLKQLSDSNVITEVEVHCLYIDGLPDNVNPKVVVRVYSQTDGFPAKELGEYKSSTARHTGTPKYDQSWLVGVTSLDTFIEVNVYHKRKPLPKKRLGFVRFSMEEIYRDFDSVPAKLLADTNAKMQLKRRKRVRGSIISKLASASERPMEIRDDSWRQRLNRPPKSGSSILSEDEDEGFEDYDQEVSVLSGHSICLDGTFPPSPVGIPLRECESEAKVYLSIRYVNDMRRYA